MTLVRNPPSGPPVIFDADVLSVFGRTGNVIAVYGDYDGEQVTNGSVSASGATLQEALDGLRGTNGISNQSGAAGTTVSEALDGLLARVGGAPGYLRDSFIGGATAVSLSSNTDARIGCRRWNFIVNGAGGTPSAAKLPGVAGAIGIYRITSRTGAAGGAHIYLGSAGGLPFRADSWSECTFRARFDNVQGAGERCQVGVNSALTGLIGAATGAGFFGSQNANPNYQTVTSLGGASSIKNSGVPIDAAFHDFRIVRVSATVIQFRIDGVLVSTHTSPGDPVPAAATEMAPIIGAIGGGAATFTDIDDYEFIPS